MATVFGWLRLAVSWTSRSKRWMFSAPAFSGGSSLIAVGRRSIAWRARYTAPMPPSPTFSPSVYCPSRRVSATSARSPKITREATTDIATPPSCHVTTSTAVVASGSPSASPRLKMCPEVRNSGAIDARPTANVRVVVDGIAIARASSV